MASERSLELAARMWQWVPHSDGQREWLLCPSKVKTGACGRRWGKSEAEGVDIVLYALEHPNSIQFIIAPTDDQTKVIMGQVSRFLHAVPGLDAEIREVRSPYHNIVLLDSTGVREGTTVKARTAGPTGKGIRGNKAHRVILDEAAYIADQIVDEVVSPLLADYDGDLVKISTPCGKNHFWRDFTKGQDPNEPRYASFTFPSEANPYLSREYLADQKRNKPDRTWAQEYEAAFLDEAGGVFRGVRDAILPGRTSQEGSAPVTIGVDLARVEDFTVISVVDPDGNQLYFERFNQISWERQIGRIEACYQRFPGAKVILDSTGVGDPIFERLRKSGMRVEGYQLTNTSKESLIDNLAMLVEQGRVRLLDIPEQTNELLAYQYELTPSRNVRMNAPEGMHDDTVIALALAAWGLRKSRTIQVF